MEATDLTYDDAGNPREETTKKFTQVLVAPLDTIKATLRGNDVVQDVRTYDSSDYVYGAHFEVDVPQNCSFQLDKTLRDLGLYIQYIDNYDDHETLHCRRISRLLERMEQDGKFDRRPPHPSEVRE